MKGRLVGPRCLVLAMPPQKTPRHSEIKQTRSSGKQDISWEAMSKQNTKAQLVSLYTTRPGRQPSCRPYLCRVYYGNDLSVPQLNTT